MVFIVSRVVEKCPHLVFSAARFLLSLQPALLSVELTQSKNE
jgi:hypothetical protein